MYINVSSYNALRAGENKIKNYHDIIIQNVSRTKCSLFIATGSQKPAKPNPT